MGGPAGCVKAEAKNRVRDKALKPGGAGPWRATSGDAGAHARLHHKKRRGNRANADDQRGTKRWTLNPCEPPDTKQHGCECDAYEVMRGPPYQTLAVHRRRGRDGIMAKATAWHIRKPPSHQAIIGRRNAKQRSAGDAPEVHYSCCTHAGDKRAYQIVHDRLHMFAFHRYEWQSATSSQLEVKGCARWTLPR